MLTQYACYICALTAAVPFLVATAEKSVDGLERGRISFDHQRFLAAAGLDDVPSKKPLVTITDGTEDVTRLTFSPNSKVLAAGGSKDGKIVFWDAATGKRLKQNLVHGGDQPAYWTNLAFSPDGSLLASIRNGDSKDMRLWDWKAEREVARLDGLFVPTALTFDPTGKTLAIMDAKHVFLFNVETKKTVHKFPHKEGGFASCLSFSPDGKKLAASGAGLSPFRIWDCVKFKEEQVFSTDEGGFVGVYWTKNGKHILAIGPGRSWSRWEVATGKELKRYPFKGPGVDPVPATTLGVSPDENIIAIGMQEEFEIWTGTEGKSEVWKNYGVPAFSSDGKKLATTYHLNGTLLITIWDTAVIRTTSK